MTSATALAAALGFLLLGATPSGKPKPKPKPPTHRLGKRVTHGKQVPLRHAPGSRAEAYAAMSAASCLAALNERHIPFSREEPKRGVEIPVRLT
ncbi:MAG TPA: hypothetical protein VGF76_03035, partial [Polyangiaceae bacterium]